MTLASDAGQSAHDHALKNDQVQSGSVKLVHGRLESGPGLRHRQTDLVGTLGGR